MSPRFSASERIVIKAKLDEVATGAAARPPTPQDYGHTEASPRPRLSARQQPTATRRRSAPTAAPDTVAAPVADAFTDGWFSDGAVWPQAILWALPLAADQWRRGDSASRGASLDLRLIAVSPFLVVLYFFFENAARLLPPNL